MKTGQEPIVDEHGRPVGSLVDFWRWSSSNLLDNAMRGRLAEYLVGLALGVTSTGVRREWDAFDHVTADGIKVEVKSSAYLQSCHQSRPSAIVFGVRETLAWLAESNTYLTEVGRPADVYVFCVFTEQDPLEANPLDTRQWDFYVASTRQLNEILGIQKTITLGSLMTRVQPTKTTFDELKNTVTHVASTAQDGHGHGRDESDDDEPDAHGKGDDGDHSGLAPLDEEPGQPADGEGDACPEEPAGEDGGGAS